MNNWWRREPPTPKKTSRTLLSESFVRSAMIEPLFLRAAVSLTSLNSANKKDGPPDTSEAEDQGTSKIIPLEESISPSDARTDSNSKGINQVKAGPWRRFFARPFDLWWEILVVGYIAVIAAPNIVIPWLNDFPTRSVLIVLSVGFALLLDSVTYMIFGNTPGKALLGIRVKSILGKGYLNQGEYLYRNLSFWGSGLWFGIPLITFIPLIVGYLNVKNGNRTEYDVANECQVYYEPIGIFRHFLFVVLSFALTYALGISGFMLKYVQITQLSIPVQ